MTHPLECRCGTVRGLAASPRAANRAVCYHTDCQAFACFLERERDILDERGGCEVIQALSRVPTGDHECRARACC
jgi:hypothetical protein